MRKERIPMKKLLGEFKDFISRGNVMDMAVGVIVGSAFTAIVNSLVGDLLNPILGLITGGTDFSDLKLVLGAGENAATLNYGAFISAVINFLLIALVIFLITKGINAMHRKKIEVVQEAPAPRLCPYCKSEIAQDATRCPHCTSQLDA